jgi:hypothetical protein
MLSLGQLNAVLTQKYLSEPLMIIVLIEATDHGL